jgi:hypothetical protein
MTSEPSFNSHFSSANLFQKRSPSKVGVHVPKSQSRVTFDTSPREIQQYPSPTAKRARASERSAP